VNMGKKSTKWAGGCHIIFGGGKTGRLDGLGSKASEYIMPV